MSSGKLCKRPDKDKFIEFKLYDIKPEHEDLPNDEFLASKQLHDRHIDAWPGNQWISGFAQGPNSDDAYIDEAISKRNCIDLVRQHHPLANGAAYKKDGSGSCFAEYNMESIKYSESFDYETISLVGLNSKICFKQSPFLTKDFDDDDFGFMVKTGYGEPIEYSFKGISGLGCDGWVTARFEID